jgi:hypothetical protein
LAASRRDFFPVDIGATVEDRAAVRQAVVVDDHGDRRPADARRELGEEGVAGVEGVRGEVGRGAGEVACGGGGEEADGGPTKGIPRDHALTLPHLRESQTQLGKIIPCLCVASSNRWVTGLTVSETFNILPKAAIRGSRGKRHMSHVTLQAWSDWKFEGADKWTDWECIENVKCPPVAGAYVLGLRPRSEKEQTGLGRLLERDPHFILDIGESSNLQRRVATLLHCMSGKGNEGHMAGWRLGSMGLMEKLRAEPRDFRVSYCVAKKSAKDEAYRLESEILRAYYGIFGELPPLNYKFNWSTWEET